MKKSKKIYQALYELVIFKFSCMKDAEKRMFFMKETNTPKMPKILITLRKDGKNGGPFNSHMRILQSGLQSKYELKPVWIPKPRELMRRKGMNALVSKIKEEAPDLVQLTGLQLEGFFVMRACKKAKVKTILAVHGSSMEALTVGALKKGILRFLERYTVKKADYVFGVSDYVSNWSVCRCAKHSVETIYNMYNINQYNGAADIKLREKLGLKPTDVVVASTGRIVKDKGFDVFWEVIQSIGHTDSIKYLIAGDGAFFSEWENDIKLKGYDKEVFLLGYQENVVPLLDAADIFMICTKHETLCMSLLEAANARLPLVATNVGGIPEIISEGQNGYLISKNDVKAFQSALLKLINDERLRKEMGANAQAMVSHKFGEKQILEALDNLYTKAIAK